MLLAYCIRTIWESIQYGLCIHHVLLRWRLGPSRLDNLDVHGMIPHPNLHLVRTALNPILLQTGKNKYIWS